MFTPVVVAINTLVLLGASVMLPTAPVMMVNAPVSTMLPVRFTLPLVVLPVAVIFPATFSTLAMLAPWLRLMTLLIEL